MTPIQRYKHDLDAGIIAADSAQLEAIHLLQALYEKLLYHELSRKRADGLLQRLLGKHPYNNRIAGIYLWGGVGRGKTYLMDIFYEALPFRTKLRTHFHRFMQRVHQNLATVKGAKNPLQLVARQIADEAQVLCFDEFFVSDIGDAMILAGLLDEMLKLRVVFVMTSNIAPELLYENGLQRERFMPAIHLLQQHTRVFEMDGGTDYRLRSLTKAKLYHCPAGAEVDLILEESFKSLAPDFGETVRGEAVEILGRMISSVCSADDVIWFDFLQLCDSPRSAFDYVEIAKIYHALLLSNVPELDSSRDDQARRFVNLVDELYDRRVKLIISAMVPLEHLYTGSQLTAPFQRTLSRLQEMQSHDYLASAHRA